MTTEARWLDDDERQAWDPFIGLLLKLPNALDAAVRKRTGMTHFEYAVVSALSEAEERTRTMSELAEFANASLSRLSHVVARLEAQGWVRRERDPGDGRVQIAVLTDEGCAKVVESAPGHAEAVQQLVFDRLTPAQARQLVKLCEAMLEAPVEVRPPVRTP
jgi:DNA-binding MarR family transcriptional regulator